MTINLRSFLHSVAVRMQGPGGLYNTGDVLGFGVGLAVGIAGARGQQDVAAAAENFVAGSPAAVAFTAATAIFLWGGEQYHQAWKNGFPPDPARNRWGDLFSGVGATALGLGLSMIGSPVLAATSGFLHAAGKFGSALGVEKDFVLAGRTIPAAGLCRGSVLLSRVPAVWITVASIAGAVDLAPAADAMRRSILPATMLVCYGLWAIADIKLMTKSGAAIRPIAESVAALFRLGAERWPHRSEDGPRLRPSSRLCPSARYPA
jgi:hypothetical protein